MKSLNYSIARSFLDALYAIGFALRENPTSEQFAKFYKRSHHFNEYLYKNESNGFITFGEYQELKREYHRIQDQISALSESFMPCVDEVTDASSVITTPVQPGTENTPQPSTPGQLRLHTLLAEYRCIFLAAKRTKKRLFIPLPHEIGQHSTQFLCSFR